MSLTAAPMTVQMSITAVSSVLTDAIIFVKICERLYSPVKETPVVSKSLLLAYSDQSSCWAP